MKANGELGRNPAWELVLVLSIEEATSICARNGVELPDNKCSVSLANGNLAICRMDFQAHLYRLIGDDWLLRAMIAAATNTEAGWIRRVEWDQKNEELTVWVGAAEFVFEHKDHEGGRLTLKR